MISAKTLEKIDSALKSFMENRQIFLDMGVQDSFSVPRLHSVVHYKKLVRYFGAPNGLCSSITESKHINAIKKPWRRSNRFNVLGQMLTTNSRLDKLRAARISFSTWGMVKNPYVDEEVDSADATETPNDLNPDNHDDDDGAHDGPTVIGFVKLANTPHKSYIPLSL